MWLMPVRSLKHRVITGFAADHRFGLHVPIRLTPRLHAVVWAIIGELAG